MFYHAINGEGTGPVPEDLSPVLLWTNPNPTVAFAPQTVELDLSEYAGVIVESNANTTSKDYGSREYCKITETKVLGRNSASYGGGTGRAFIVSSTGVEFKNCTEGSMQANGDCIPVKIYGVKKYVVEPVEPELEMILRFYVTGEWNEQTIYCDKFKTLDYSVVDKYDVHLYGYDNNDSIIINQTLAKGTANSVDISSAAKVKFEATAHLAPAEITLSFK